MAKHRHPQRGGEGLHSCREVRTSSPTEPGVRGLWCLLLALLSGQSRVQGDLPSAAHPTRAGRFVRGSPRPRKPHGHPVRAGKTVAPPPKQLEGASPATQPGSCCSPGQARRKREAACLQDLNDVRQLGSEPRAWISLPGFQS